MTESGDERSFRTPFGAREESPEPVVEAAAPNAVARVMLYLSWLRSTAVLMTALRERFPNAADWEAQMDDPEFHEEIAAFEGVIRDVTAAAALGAASPTIEELERAGGAHYDRALDCLALTAERLGVDPADLLVALVHALH